MSALANVFSPSPSGVGLGWGLFEVKYSGTIEPTSPTPYPSPKGEGL